VMGLASTRPPYSSAVASPARVAEIEGVREPLHGEASATSRGASSFPRVGWRARAPSSDNAPLSALPISGEEGVGCADSEGSYGGGHHRGVEAAVSRGLTTTRRWVSPPGW